MIKVQIDGKETEVFTAEDVAAREKTAAEAAEKKAQETYQANENKFKSENETLSKERDEAAQKAKDAEDLLKKAEEEGKNDGQIQRLRQERDDAKKKADEAATNVDKKFADWEKKQVDGLKADLLKSASNGDAELQKKIEYHFDNYRPNDNTAEAVKERMAFATTAATGKKVEPSHLDGRTNAGDRGASEHKQGGDKREPTPNEKALGNMLGVTEKDRERHAKFKKDRESKKDAGLIPPGEEYL